MAFDTTERLNLAIAGGAIATSAAFAPPLFTASLTLGAVVEAVNYRALSRHAGLFFGGQIANARGWTAGFGLRFLMLATAMAVSLKAGAHPVGLVIGLSTIVPAVVIVAFRNPPSPPVSAGDVPPPDDPSWDEWNPWMARERDPDEEDES